MPNKIIDGMIRGQAGLDSIGTIISAFQSERVIAQGFSGALKIGQSLLRAIVVDDSSTNNSADIVARPFVEDEGVSLLHINHSGRPAARNAGFAAARGDWIMFLDVDDYLLAGDYETPGDLTVLNDLGLIVCHYSRPNFAPAHAQDAGTVRSAFSVNHLNWLNIPVQPVSSRCARSILRSTCPSSSPTASVCRIGRKNWESIRPR